MRQGSKMMSILGLAMMGEAMIQGGGMVEHGGNPKPRRNPNYSKPKRGTYPVSSIHNLNELQQDSFILINKLEEWNESKPDKMEVRIIQGFSVKCVSLKAGYKRLRKYLIESGFIYETTFEEIENKIVKLRKNQNKNEQRNKF